MRVDAVKQNLDLRGRLHLYSNTHRLNAFSAVLSSNVPKASVRKPSVWICHGIFPHSNHSAEWAVPTKPRKFHHGTHNSYPHLWTLCVFCTVRMPQIALCSIWEAQQHGSYHLTHLFVGMNCQIHHKSLFTNPLYYKFCTFNYYFMY